MRQADASDAPVSGRYRPAAQLVHVTVPVPAAKVPMGHGVQAVAPLLAPYWPAPQLTQLVVREVGWIRPAAQTVH